MFDSFDILDHITKSLGPHVFRFTAGLILRGTDKRIEVGSGVFVRVGERFFVATAAHNIVETPNKHILLVRDDLPDSEYGGFVRRFPEVGQAATLDLGYLELSPERARECGKEFLPISRVRPLCGHAEPQDAYVFGYPAAASDLEPPSTVSLGGVGSAMLTRPLDSLEDVDADTDIVLNFSGDAYDPDTGAASKPLIPKGLSGGGIWTIPRTVEAKLWSPEDVYLIGIQSRWRPTREVLLGVQIQHWLMLIESQYPDLTEIIQPVIETK